MHRGLMIASALLAASCDVSPEQSADQARDAVAATGNDTTDETGAADGVPDQAVRSSNFAILVATSNLYEIASGRLAMKQGQSAETREFAKMMVEDHSASLRDILAAVDESDVEVVLPTQIDAQQQSLLDRLAQANAADFDRIYINQQVDGHRTALKLHQEYQAGSGDKDFLAFSQKIRPVIQAHYDRLQKDFAPQSKATTAPVR
jgi:putative membrane protein